MRRLLSIIVVLGLLLPTAYAAAPIDELEFADAEQKARYRKLTDELRCPKCPNTNLSGSDAPIAANLRAEIHEQITEGRSDAEIIDFMTARYGDFVLYRPPLNFGTAFLWFGPLVLLVAGFVVLRRMLVAARSSAAEEALSSEELQKLKALLDDKDAR